MRKLLVLLLLLGAAPAASAQTPQGRIVAPVLKNRAEVMAERQRIANRYLKPGDSLYIRVYAYVDEQGVTRQPDIKVPSGNARADTAAMQLVKRMVWVPARNVRRGVMLTIPVVLVRKK